MSIRHSFPRTLLTFVVLLLGACAPMSDAVKPGEGVQLDGREWTLASMGGSAPVAGSSVTLNFEQGNASGSAGCNQYRGPYTANGSSLVFGAIASTKRACVEDERNAQETAYLDALSRVKSFRATTDRLVLADTAGATLLEYSRHAAQ
jgi:heat shock protein HslJ